MSDGVGKPILVTGAHRSGTTWVGKMLSASPSVGYIEEAFNPYFRTYRPGMCKGAFRHWFTYVCEENERQFYDDLADTMNFRFHLKEQIKALVTNRFGFRTFVKDYTAFMGNRYVYRPRPLLKDPIAIFSTEWLARTFNMNVVILIRHPAAFASSIKRMNWPHNFANFLHQPLLVRDYLYPFEDEMREYTVRQYDIIGEAILLWKMFYYFVDKMKTKHPEYIFIRHEDLSTRPLEELRGLFGRLNIEFTERIQRIVLKHSNASNPAEARDGVMHQLRRDSMANIGNWKHRLTKEEIGRIREGVKSISKWFYDDKDWE